MELRYYCESCKVYQEESTCSICGNRTINRTAIYWDDSKNVPIIATVDLLNSNDTSKARMRKISNDIRPVFPEERLLIELVLGTPFKYKNSSCWSTTGGTYIFDGKKIKIVIKDLKKVNDKLIRDDFFELIHKNDDTSFKKYMSVFVEENSRRFNELKENAEKVISERVNPFDYKSTFVSFSGGKDSTVVSDLVRTTIGSDKVIHIFGDTTLEFPETYEYVNRFKSTHRFTPMLNAKNKEKNFYDMCEVIGPPSRVMRWCCTVFKTGAITQYINTMFRNYNRVLTFYGIRRSESASRNKYDMESDSPKITKQRIVSPIIDWLDVDVWLYILSKNIDFNNAYRYGFTRVGCWCCPNNSSWSEFLSKIFHPEDFYKFRDMLVTNATNIGKNDPEEYVDSGAWKAKQGGDGIEYGKKLAISFEPCATEENRFNYELQKPIDKNLYELFKPFGELNFDMGNSRLNEVYVLDRNKRIIMKLRGRLGETTLKVSIINLPIARAKTVKDAERKVKCQLTKFQTCLNCSACMSVCRFNAIKIKFENGNLDYRVDENKCVHCNECINHFVSGCYLRKVLATKDKD